MGPNAKSRILGTISMLQQAVRYGNHYAAPRVLLTDYLNAVLIEIVSEKPEDDSESNAAQVNTTPTGSGNRKSSTRQDIATQDIATRLRWIFVSGGEVRLLTGIAFWLSCVDWRLDLRKAEIEAERGKTDDKGKLRDLQRQDDELTSERNKVM